MLFFEKGLDILKKDGILVYITPDKYLIREYGAKIRELLLQNSIIQLFDISRADDAFNAAIYPLISIIKKNNKNDTIQTKFANTIKNISKDFEEISVSQESCKKNNLIELIHPEDKELIDKIFDGSQNLSEIINKNQMFCGTPRAKDYHNWKNYITEQKNLESSQKLLVCSNLSPYRINFKKKVRTVGLVIEEPYFQNRDGIIPQSKWQDFLFSPKILIRCNDTRITAVLDQEGSVFIGIYGIKVEGKILNNYKYLLSLLNSKLYQWVFSVQNPSVKIAGDFFSINSPQLLRLPYKEPSSKEKKDIDSLVDKILKITQEDDCLENPLYEENVKKIEKEIDNIIYTIFDLTPAEIEIIEKSF